MTDRTEKLHDDICFAIKDENGYFYCGLNKWDKQLRKAQLFHSFKYAVSARDSDKWAAVGAKIVKVRIFEMEEYNPDLDI